MFVVVVVVYVQIGSLSRDVYVKIKKVYFKK